MRGFARWSIRKSLVRALLLGGAGVAVALALGGLGFAATFTVAGPTDTVVPVPGTTIKSTTARTTTSQATTAPTTTAPSAGTVIVPAQPGVPSAVKLHPAGGGSATVQWGGGTFSVDASVTANPDPPLGVTLTGVRNQLVGIVAVSTTGSPIRRLHAPLGVVFAGSKKGYVPVTSTDGKHFKKLARLKQPKLPAGQLDGYYVASGGRIQVLTKHLTIFGVLSSENRAKWGDIAKLRTQPPKLDLISPVASGQTVTFTVTVDEPVALLLSANAEGKSVALDGETTIAHRRLGGPPALVKTVTLARGGSYAVTVVLAQSWHGPLSLVLVAGDSGGNRATKTLALGG